MWRKKVEAYQKCLLTGKQVVTNLAIRDKKNVKFLVNIPTNVLLDSRGCEARLNRKLIVKAFTYVYLKTARIHAH